MATQGIVSILDVDGKNVLFKVIAGSDGYNAAKLAQWVREQADTFVFTIKNVYEAAKQVSFGTTETLVVQDSAGSLCYDGDGGPDELGGLYRDYEKFRDPRFNPRWEQGIADYIEVVVLDAEQRPLRSLAEAAVSSFLEGKFGEVPRFEMIEDGEHGYAFWLDREDTTSYVHHDLKIEWYGTEIETLVEKSPAMAM